MTLTLRQVRECDGACCEQAPRFPNADHSDCIYHDAQNGKDGGGCVLMRDPNLIPDGDCAVIPGVSAADAFEQTCVKWPQENSVRELGDTGACCWQYVDNGRRKTQF